MQTTTNFGLKKPDPTDAYDIGNENDNMDIIDAQIKANSDAVALKASINSPAFTGTPTGTTPIVGDNSTKISTTAFVAAAIAALVNSSPAALDTLKELADALGDDPNFATTMTNALAGKAAAADLTSHLADDVKHVYYATAAGAANTYAVTLSPVPTSYVDGMGVSVKINVASTGASTINVNGLGAKPILDSLGNTITSGGLKAGLIYSMRYNSTTGNFIVQGKGGGGNATATQLLIGATATVDSGPITGNMPNNGALNLIPSGLASVPIPAGYTSGGSVAQVNVPAANVLTGTTIANVAGTMPNQGSPTLQPGTSITPGYYGGGSVANAPHSSQTYSTPGTYTFTVPASVTKVTAIIGGAGGGGGNGINGSGGGGGGGAGGVYLVDIPVTPGQQITVVVGAGGAGASTSGANGYGADGATGGQSSFGSYVAGGGVGGYHGTDYTNNGGVGGAGGAGGGNGSNGGSGGNGTAGNGVSNGSGIAGTGATGACGAGNGGNGARGTSTQTLGIASAGTSGRVIVTW
ncbi:glycine-rich domain-containing protein [Desulfosporosinus sp. SB140]|uniref:glycine-rich domain-containing protein n=1 Tax=Desulfosporosinus paludis TaxID=3115649 RepID=UPI00388F195B